MKKNIITIVLVGIIVLPIYGCGNKGKEIVEFLEAKSRCEDRGGYLATITKIKEYERIKEGIEDSKQIDVAFWVGASDVCWREPDEDYYMGYTAASKFWAPGEPSYRTDVAGTQVKEEYVYLSYGDTEETG